MPEEVQQIPQLPQQQQTSASEGALFGLSYITIVPAIYFLVTAPLNQNPKLRFHAWQSIFLCAACVAAWVLITVIGLLPFIHLIDLLLVPLVWLGFTVVWLVVTISAFMGKMMGLPVLGALAAKKAGL